MTIFIHVLRVKPTYSTNVMKVFTLFSRFWGWRQEECAPGGCFVELSIQLAIVFMGKQFMLSIMEYYIPLLWRAINWVRLIGWRLKVES